MPVVVEKKIPADAVAVGDTVVQAPNRAVDGKRFEVTGRRWGPKRIQITFSDDKTRTFQNLDEFVVERVMPTEEEIEADEKRRAWHRMTSLMDDYANREAHIKTMESKVKAHETQGHAELVWSELETVLLEQTYARLGQVIRSWYKTYMDAGCDELDAIMAAYAEEVVDQIEHYSPLSRSTSVASNIIEDVVRGCKMTLLRKARNYDEMGVDEFLAAQKKCRKQLRDFNDKQIAIAAAVAPFVS